MSSLDEQIAELEEKKAALIRAANFQEFPKHIRIGEQTFQAENAEHEKAIRAGTEKAVPIAVPEPLAPVAVTEPRVPELVAPEDSPKGVAEGTVAEAKDLIAQATSKRQLRLIESAENRREAGARSGVLEAIERRQAELDKE